MVNYVDKYKPDIILVFYTSQARNIASMNLGVEVSTVHSYQGKQADNVMVVRQLNNNGNFGLCS